MDSQRWEQIQSIFLEALDLPADQRDAFVSSACGQNAEVHAEVQSMLAAHFAEPSLAAESWLKEENDATLESRIGERVGAYRIRRMLGRGGMGEVYLAERADDQYEQEVALKILGHALATPESTHRFRTERQILARLEHPNIARLFDGGVDDRGRPYLVLEYIHGTSIFVHCDRQSLNLLQRLDLFLEVCDAIEFAHRNLIVHRDVKASNVLVDEVGGVKLLDFGIAKLLGPEALGSEEFFTRTGVKPMTPECAAPEQILGGPITTATDVYALGVLLYELLTGHRPYRVPVDSPIAVERVVCREQPSRPSAVVTRPLPRARVDGDSDDNTPERVSADRGTRPHKLHKLLVGDLDNIVMMALRKEPERRYASAGQFAEDIRRYRAGQTVRARADTVAYRFRKFVGRNRVMVGAAVIIVGLMGGATAVTALQSRQVRLERDRARQETAKAGQVTDFLLGLFDAAAPTSAPRDTMRIREVLDRGRAQIAAIADQPGVQVSAIQTLSHVYWRLGRNDLAAELAQQGVEVCQRAFGPEGPRVASALYWLGTIRQSQLQFDSAESLLSRALAIQRQAYGRDDSRALRTQFRLGMVLHGTGQTDRAHELLGEWQMALGALDGEEDEDVATLLSSLGNYLMYANRVQEAEAAVLKAMEIHTRLHGAKDYRVASDMNVLASIYIRQGRLDEAKSVAEDALHTNRRIFPEGHYSLALSLDNLGDALSRSGSFEEAEPYLLEALEVYRGLYGDQHGAAAHAHLVLGDFYRRWKRLDLAESHLRQAVATYKGLYGKAYLITIRARRVLAAVLGESDEQAEAMSILEEDIEVLRRERGKDDPDTRAEAELLERLSTSR